MKRRDYLLVAALLAWLNVWCVLFAGNMAHAQAIIADHACTDITQIPEWAIVQAKETLHIGYGHTSHGSQLTSEMTGLVSFADSGGARPFAARGHFRMERLFI